MTYARASSNLPMKNELTRGEENFPTPNLIKKEDAVTW